MSTRSTLYIDESGKSSLREKENNPFIMTGVIIDDSEISSIEGFFTYIKRKFGINPYEPFHSYHVYECPDTKLSDKDLAKLSRILADFVSLIPIQIRLLEVDKDSFKKALGITSNEDFKGNEKRKEMPDFPYRVMSADLFAWFAKYLDKSFDIGQIIVDSRRGGDHHLLNTLNMCKEGHIPFTDDELSKKINGHVTAICFAEKNFLSGGLEITDLISYISYFRVCRLISQNEHLGVDKIWEEIRNRTDIIKVEEKHVRGFFGLKQNEVHKYLNT